MSFSLELDNGCGRLGSVLTSHGSFQTPMFMPVGTRASVKGLTPQHLGDLEAQIILSNAYHLHLRPGDKRIKELGGLHKYMGWDKPILTDSGGFQVYSLASTVKTYDWGVEFASHLDGSKIKLTPEDVVEIQENLGVDIAMVLDICLASDATRQQVREALERTQDWASRSLLHKTRHQTQLFGIVQGGMYLDIREEAAKWLAENNFDGFAIGGLSVGESQEKMFEVLDVTVRHLPQNKPRYLMGVGTATDIIGAVRRGVDMFDCVMPTRSARFGRVFVKGGYYNIKNASNSSNLAPLEDGCDCYSCQNFSRAYINHLFKSGEMLSSTLTSIHNLRYYMRLMKEIRSAIKENRLDKFEY